MANSIWQATIQNEAGDIIPGAEITVTDEDTGLPATIFSTIGGAAKSNPFFADSNGFAQFYAGSGTYRVNAEDTGTGQSQLWRYIRFGDAASRDVGTSAGQLMEVGAFGLGSGDAELINDLDSIGLTKTSRFTVPTGSTVPSFSFGTCHTIVYGPTAATQIAINVTTLRMESRTKSSSVWTDWEEIYHSGNLNHLQNTSGGSVASNATTAGSNLTPAQSGTWLNASGASIANNGYGLWIKQ